MTIDPNVGEDAVQGGFNALMGLELVEVGAERVIGRLRVDERHHQPYGLVHGGVHASLAETTASVGAAQNVQGGGAVGLSNHTDFLHAARDGTLTAEATPLDRGRSTQLWAVAITDEQGRLVAQSKVRLYNLRPR